MPETICVSTPGRVCLFGEHQDYLGLPVIPCAISVRIAMRASRRKDQRVVIDLPDVGARDEFTLAGQLTYAAERDYLRSTVNVLRRAGFTWATGLDTRVHGTIPINSGTSSSSALIVTWVNVLTRMSDQEEELDAEAIARYAHAAEVLEFGEPGGMMDHFATAVGGTFFLEFEPTIRIQRLPAKLGAFVLGDSREPKDTKGILSRVKDQVVAIAGRLATHEKPLSLQKTAFEDLDRYRHDLNEEEMILLRGTIRNRDVTLWGRELLLQDDLVHQQLGDLLNEHEAVLRDALRISTRKIDRMLDAAMSAGALGGKINGSGGGGCMFAYAPEHPEAVAEAIERAGGTAWIVHEDEGTRTEPEEVRA